MEKKSIGQFIATLRKANGMTQRQLADKLNVSDKAVSRWERDESAPDLTLIPVLAEVFGVTSDEILRGERKNIEAEESPRTAEKTEKQLANMLSSVQHKLNMRNIIVVGIAVVGLIVAMIANFVYNRANLGFYLSSIIYLIAIVCETIFAMQAFQTIKNSDYESSEIGMCRRKMLSTIEVIYGIIIVLFAFTLPLIVYVSDSYLGLYFEDWFSIGIGYATIGVLLCIMIIVFVGKYAIKKLDLCEADEHREYVLLKFRRNYFLLTAIILIGTMAGQFAFNELVWPTDLVPGKTFNNLADYIEYMETPNDEYAYGEGNIVITKHNLYVVETDESSDGEHEEEMGFVFGADGETVLARYIHRNKSVILEDYQWDGETLKSITVYTPADFRTGRMIMDSVNTGFAVALVAEIIIISVMYKKKKKTIYTV